jgi:hypothetical protein
MTKFRHRKNGGAWTEVNVSLPYAIPGTGNGDTVDAQGIGPTVSLAASVVGLPLDAISAGAAFSVRLLRTAYGFASPCMDVRRSSDNAVATIPFKLYAPRATPYWLDEEATLAHCGAGNGFAAAWYDQTTNARHITNATTGQQPRIVNAGVIEKQNGLPALYFDNALSSRLTNTSPFMFAAGSGTSIFVAKLPTQTNRTIWAERNSGTATPIYRLEIGGTGNNDIAYRWRNDAATTTSSNLFIDEVNDTLRNYALRDTGSQFQPYVNGVEEAPVNYTRSGTTTVNIFGLGANPTSANIEAITGHISEAIFFGSALSNANMNTINLSQGAAFGISVEEYLTPVQRLIQINGTPDGGSSFAVGGGGVRDWEDPIFIDRAKQARGWQSPCVLDSLSRCASLSSGTTATFFFSSFQDGSGVYAGATPNRGGRFRVELTSGAATLTSNTGCTNVTQINSTTWEFDCDWVANKALTFTPSAFPLSVSIVDVNLLANHAAGEIFDPLFLSTLPTGGAWRNMDWMGTNSSPIVEWADYPTAASQNWFRIPVSVMVALCNAKSLNPWFNMPHQASTDFVTQFATYVLANLNSGLKVRVEVSNEAWNFIFGQATYFSNLANSEWPSETGEKRMAQVGKRFVRDIQIWNTVWAGQTDRVIGVLGTQAGNTSITVQLLDATAWLNADPTNYIAPYTLAKELAIADYVGWSNATTQGNTIKAALDISHAAAVASIKAQFATGLALSKGYIDTNVPLAANRGLRLVSYEYNNHFDLGATSASGLYSAGEPVAGALAAFVEATTSQEMADALIELLDYWKANGGSTKTFFVHLGRFAKSGTWGGISHLGHTNLVWEQVKAWYAANTRWWAQ